MKIFLLIAVFMVCRGEAKSLAKRKGASMRKILEADSNSLFTQLISRFDKLEEKDEELTAKVEKLTAELAKVIPAKKIRLLGRTGKVGRLELWHNGEWGTVCGDNFNDKVAAVVCRSLGFTGGEKYVSSAGSYEWGSIDHTGGSVDNSVVKEVNLGWTGNGHIWFGHNFNCVGTEQDIFACPGVFPGWGGASCLHYEDVYMKCT